MKISSIRDATDNILRQVTAPLDLLSVNIGGKSMVRLFAQNPTNINLVKFLRSFVGFTCENCGRR